MVGVLSEIPRRVVLGAGLAAVTAAVAACGSGSGAAATGRSSEPTGSADPTSLLDRTPGLVKPGAVHIGAGEPTERARHVVETAQLLYTFWDTGEQRYLDRSVADTFRDNTLPAGRPQGPSGPVAASKTFRAAVPDLTCELADLYVVGDTFTARLVFRGHFTGSYNGIRGRGQRIAFDAIDIQNLGDGNRITQDWHLEDNLTFLQQAQLVTVAQRKP